MSSLSTTLLSKFEVLLIAATMLLLLCSMWTIRQSLRQGLIPALLVINLALAYWLNVLDILAIILLLAFFFLTRYSKGRPSEFYLLALVMLITVLFGAHLLPGFSPLTVYQGIHFGPSSSAYSLRLNLDKILAGIIICAVYFDGRDFRLNVESLGKILLPTAMGMSLVWIAFAADQLAWEPKLSPYHSLWIPFNLLFTCIIEEVFFRGLVFYWLKKRLHNIHMILFLSALIFGLAHFGGGTIYMLFAATAGLCYGWAYMRTASLLAAGISHFCVNLMHSILFTYPGPIG